MPLRIELPSVGSLFEGEAVNISSAGMFVAMPDPPAIGTNLKRYCFQRRQCRFFMCVIAI